MTFVITQSCCADASCVSVCPVNCIHPTPDEPDFGHVDTLYVDPSVCIDCGACLDACPVGAARPADSLVGREKRFVEINAEFYKDHRTETEWTAPAFTHASDKDGGRLRVAIVGTGPAASYTARHLLTTTDCVITMIERRSAPGGLLRAGVAPDHTGTRGMVDTFRWVYRHPRTTVHLGVEVGRDITHEELTRHHHAVVYGTGAGDNPELGIDGEDSPAVVTAAELVRWFTGHEDQAPVRLDSERVVVVGNGNVALDVARVLLATPDVLRRSDVSDAARAELERSAIREVVLLARRGPQHAAFTRPELLMLPESMDAEVVIARSVGVEETVAAITEPRLSVLRELPVVDLDWASEPAPGRRLVLAFDAAVESVGDGELTLRHTGSAEGTWQTPSRMLVRANGFRVRPIEGLPFDPVQGRIPQDAGRVLDDTGGEALPGTYVVGWAKRGAQGGIGANRHDAEETVASMLQDALDGRLEAPAQGPLSLRRSLLRTGRTSTRRGLKALDREHDRRRTAAHEG
ncbi:4Fe-4S binding protein [Barrientosiimonas humi]|uniref:4Fe-4S binding protein n=1 Tax=Barrientosiimonas humi TaxID=999931 RepID=UPI00370D7B6B